MITGIRQAEAVSKEFKAACINLKACLHMVKCFNSLSREVTLVNGPMPLKGS
jgi:hypothetical protein